MRTHAGDGRLRFAVLNCDVGAEGAWQQDQALAVVACGEEGEVEAVVALGQPRIAARLTETHRLTWRYPFIWENWHRLTDQQ